MLLSFRSRAAAKYRRRQYEFNRLSLVVLLLLLSQVPFHHMHVLPRHTAFLTCRRQWQQTGEVDRLNRLVPDKLLLLCTLAPEVVTVQAKLSAHACVRGRVEKSKKNDVVVVKHDWARSFLLQS